MNKKALLTLVMLLFMVAFVQAEVFKQIQFVDEYGQPKTDLSYVKVYNGGTATASTIYKKKGGVTAITNPLTLTSTNTTLTAYNGMVSFWDLNKQTHDIEAVVGGALIKIQDIGVSDTRITVPEVARQGAIRKKGMYDDFQQTPLCVAKLLGAGAATGGEGHENIFYSGQNMFEYHIVGTATLFAFPHIAGGLSIGLDVANDDGVEICPGIVAGGNAAFTVGTDPAFYFKCRFDIADVTGSDELHVGFRIAYAYNADPTAYTDMAAFDIDLGVINLTTNLNNAGVVTTDTTLTDWQDGATHTLEVYVSETGVVTYKIDGVTPTVVAEFTFDDGDVVVPFFYNRYAATTPGVIYIEEWDCGLQ